MDVGDDIVREFLVESHENLDQLDREFVALEENPHQPERLAAVFRTIHTIKGTSGFLGLHKLESLTHVAENLLSKLRDGEIVLTPDITSALLAVVDAVRDMLGHIEQTGAEGSNAYESLADRLTALRDGALAEAAAPDDAAPGQDPKEAAAPPAPPAPVEDKAPPPPKAPAAETGHVPASVDASPTPAPPPKTTAKPGPVSSAPVADSYVRVDVGLLDRLMNLVGELVLARNQVLRIGSTVEDQAFQSTSQRLNHITSELQESVMKTRMQPVRNVWDKLPRVVRDLSVQVGKQVRVEMVGRETEIDRAILEAIKDPLTHIVRNAVDHGLESPDDRAKAGKGRTGNLRLRAFHEGGQVNIEIADDGRGLNVDAIRQKAIDRGVMSAERAARASDRELIQLVFQPAFSTAQQVTQISGRGVGMDVVKTNIEKIGGTVDLTSTRGKGTTVKIKIPLTLAIVPALIVTSGDQRFAIPQVSLLELVRLKDENARSAIEDVHGAPVFRLRGNLLPLVFLDQALGLPPQTARRTTPSTSWCCRRTTGSSAWSSTRCGTPRRSWSSPWAACSATSRSLPGPRSWATARSR